MHMIQLFRFRMSNFGELRNFKKFFEAPHPFGLLNGMGEKVLYFVLSESLPLRALKAFRCIHPPIYFETY